MVGGGGYLPEEYPGGCGNDCVIDDGGEAGGAFVSEGEHRVSVIGVSYIDIAARARNTVVNKNRFSTDISWS